MSVSDSSQVAAPRVVAQRGLCNDSPSEIDMRALLSLVLPLSLLLMACPGNTGQETPSPGDDDDDFSWTPQPQWEGEVHGVLHDEAGAALSEVLLTLCGHICLYAQSGTDGSFSFTSVPPMTAVLETSSYPNNDPRGWSRYFDFLPIGENEVITLATPVVTPQVSNTQVDLTGNQDITFADAGGLRIQFDADEVHSAPEEPDTVGLGAVELPSNRFPTQGLAGHTIHRGWALTIWDQEIEGGTGFAISAPLTSALPQGTDVAILVAKYLEGTQTGQFHVYDAELSGDGMTIHTVAGQGVDRTTMVLAASLP
jgi:hypothetical protein